jgi:[ribosomal protein S5]-alanine N-acetyltransferase
MSSSSLGPVTTERLNGRRPEQDDLAEWVRIFGDPRVQEELWPADLRTPEKVAEILKRTIAHWDRWGFGAWTVLERGGDRVVGRVGLEYTSVLGHPEVEVAWFIDPDAWGCGYATEMAEEAVRAAFTTLGLDSLISYTTPENHASQAVMRKLGMDYEADIENAGMPHVLYRLSRVT